MTYKNEFPLEPMHQFQLNFNCYFLFYIEFTIKNYLNFKGQKGQRRPEIWPWGPLRRFLKPYSNNLIPEKSGNMLKLRRKGYHKKLGFDRLLAFFGLYGLWNRKIFFELNFRHRTRLQLKFGCNWSIGSSKNLIFVKQKLCPFWRVNFIDQCAEVESILHLRMAMKNFRI